MTPRYYDAAGHIDYDAIKSYARALREQAIEAFWHSMSSRAQFLLHGQGGGRTATALHTGNSRLTAGHAHRAV